MVIELIDDKAAWDRFVDESPNSMLFHKWDFLSIMEKYSGYKLYPWGIYLDGELVAVLPLFFNKIKGMRLVYSPPRTTTANVPYLGFAYSPASAGMRQREKESYLAYIIDETESVIRRLSPNYLSIALQPGDVDIRPYMWNGYEPVLMYSYIIDLNRPLDSIWSGLDSSCRTSIKNGSKRNPSVVRSYDADTLFGMMRQRLNNPKTFYHQQSPDYLKELLMAFPDNIKMFSYYCGEELICNSVFYEYRDHCIGWMGAAGALTSVDINEYMIWDSIKKAKEAGIKKFENLGASERRLNSFKTKFNPTLTPYFYMVKRDPLYKAASGTSEMVGTMIRKAAGSPASPVNRYSDMAGAGNE